MLASELMIHSIFFLLNYLCQILLTVCIFSLKIIEIFNHYFSVLSINLKQYYNSLFFNSLVELPCKTILAFSMVITLTFLSIFSVKIILILLCNFLWILVVNHFSYENVHFYCVLLLHTHRITSRKMDSSWTPILSSFLNHTRVR